MANKTQNKSQVMDGDEVPVSINILDYAGARAKEMEAMAAVSRRTWGNNKAMQTLPRHMRRRAASHNVKRLPRRLREKGRREMASSGKPSKVKRPSRHHRRRPSNLLEEYSRRSRENVWMETHIWHAKRFHMLTKWGYRIPLHPNDKGIRAAYRGANKFCIMRDISFMCCIEIQGLQAEILEGLSQLFNSEAGLTPGATRFLTGVREGEAVLYKSGCYPRGALGIVKFLWKPLSSTDSAPSDPCPRQLWMWTHPACYNDVLTELKAALKLEKREKLPKENSSTSGDAATVINSEADSEKDIEDVKGSGNCATKTEKKTVEDCRPSILDSACFSNDVVTLTSLKDLLCRFHLNGPLSHSILQDLLKVADVTGVARVKDTCPSEVMDNADENTNQKDSEEKWWYRYFSDTKNESIHSAQAELWQQLQGLQSAGELMDSVVLSLTVRDPRIFLPKKKMRVADDPSTISECTLEAVKEWPAGVAHSPIWDENIRDNVKVNKMTESAMNELRSKLLVPGTQLQLGNDESRIPVLLIQQPGPRPQAGRPQEHSSLAGVPLQWGAGWDIIIPQAWAMAFWIGLIYRGARACGMKESINTATEMGQLHFPEGFPDTPTGQTAESEQKGELEGKYKRMPPAKRPNYIKLGTIAPFNFPWLQLITNWNISPKFTDTLAEVNGGKASAAHVVVLRNKRLLLQLDQVCSGKYKQNRVKSRKLSEQHKCIQDGGVAYAENVFASSLQYNNFLVPVRVRAVLRGVFEAFSMICVPSKDDLEAFLKDKKHGGPLEPPHKDPYQKKPKEKQALRRKTGTCDGETRTETSCKQNGVSQIGKLASEGNTQLTPKTMDSKDCKKSEMNKKTRGLCEHVANVRDSCSRSVFGYVKQGGYHLCDGRGAGVGFVVFAGLRFLLQNITQNHSETVVLVRSPRSNQYRYATLSIIS